MLPAALAGVLKAYRGAHEVITTIMLNAILVNLTEWLVGARGPFHDPRAGHLAHAGDPVDGRDPRRLATSRSGSSSRVVAAFVIWWLVGRTTIGFRSRRSARTRTPPSTAASRPPASPCWRWRSAASSPASAGPSRPRACSAATRPASTSASASTASPSPCSPGSSRCWPSPRRCCSGSCGPAQTKMAFEADVAPEIIDVILAIILLLVCAPIVVRWILRLRKPAGRGAEVQLRRDGAADVAAHVARVVFGHRCPSWSSSSSPTPSTTSTPSQDRAPCSTRRSASRRRSCWPRCAACSASAPASSTSASRASC